MSATIPEIQHITNFRHAGSMAVLYELLIRQFGGESMEVSIYDLAQACRCSEWAARTGVKELIQRGFITQSKHNTAPQGRQATKRYTVNVLAVHGAISQALKELGHSDKSEGVAVCPRCQQTLPAYKERPYRINRAS